MIRKVTLLVGCVALLTGLAPLPARAADWTDLHGDTFRGNANESLGPLALFEMKSGAGRLLAWRFLAPADCVRFYEKTKTNPARADDGAQARSVISEEIADHVSRVKGDKLVPADLKGRPEPEFFHLFYASNGVGKSWDMLGHSAEPYGKLQQLYPGMVEGIFFGLRHKAFEHASMATSMNCPWLVANYSEENKLPTIMQFAPLQDQDSYGLVVVTRGGIPIFSAVNPEDTDLTRVFADLTGLLEIMRPGNPRGWQDCAYYLRAIQPTAFANGHADPVLVGNPLVPAGLRKNGVSLVDAMIDVAADGHVTAVTITPESKIPAKVQGPLGDALKKACLFVAAVDHGKFVAASYHYRLEVPQ
jgi:hypothetical protein